MFAVSAACGEATLALISRMIGDIKAAGTLTPQDELGQCWHDDMICWGPDGIGATYTIDRYIEQHQRPFRTKLPDRHFNGHLCRAADMRVVDIYRREGDKLAENWIFIDILHFLNVQGVDVLAGLKKAL
tara:strand:- start:251 stop:637 length:387 start_codon:yes stop_codon:yes gene_type:complete